jgi:hypothetical protein
LVKAEKPKPRERTPVAELSAVRIEDPEPYYHLPWCSWSGEIAANLGCTRDSALALRARAKGKKGSFVVFYIRKEPICMGSWHEP